MAPATSAGLFFQVRCDTCFGENVVLVGSDPGIGSWNPQGALPLSTTAEKYPLWTTENALQLPSGCEKIEFKYVKLGPGGAVWEAGSNRCLLKREFLENPGSRVDSGIFRGAGGMTPRVTSFLIQHPRQRTTPRDSELDSVMELVSETSSSAEEEPQDEPKAITPPRQPETQMTPRARKNGIPPVPMGRTILDLQEEVAQLSEENRTLKRELFPLRERVKIQQDEIDKLRAEIATARVHVGHAKAKSKALSQLRESVAGKLREYTLKRNSEEPGASTPRGEKQDGTPSTPGTAGRRKHSVDSTADSSESSNNFLTLPRSRSRDARAASVSGSSSGGDDRRWMMEQLMSLQRELGCIQENMRISSGNTPRGNTPRGGHTPPPMGQQSSTPRAYVSPMRMRSPRWYIDEYETHEM
eukprot:TRINITY_DN41254_c0_g1_i1.p1 TRINITY_DN41254_c0_g1~~TRINITY_DN41254_c0_g1_i1.p1  ORF type:complete len:426 (-),score=53.28 TRINITY_DN41254_c0_g1_i1:98-1336(-)